MKIKNIRDLREFFNKYGVPLHEETVKQKRSIRHLLSKIKRGEVTITPLDYGLAESINIVVIAIKYRINDNVVHHLVETHPKELCGDGRKGDRNSSTCEFRDGISKKIRNGENPIEAAERCLREKLGFIKPPKIKQLYSNGRPQLLIGKHPCLHKIVIAHYFSCTLPMRLYDPLGYNIKRADKKRMTHFIWLPKIEPINSY